jgi:hypothetical protein
MTECSYIKRLQLYLDGWTEGDATRDIEEHLKTCPQCQAEMVELVESNGAALEIVDLAPDRSYWDSFANRVHNRIIARDVEPTRNEKKSSSRFPAFRLASVLVILIVTITTAFMMLRQPIRGPDSTVNSNQLKSQPLVSNPAGQAVAQTNNAADLISESPVNLPDAYSIRATGTAARPGLGNRNSATPEFKDLSDQIRISSLRQQTQSPPSNESRLMAPSSFADNSPDPAFRLKAAFVGQRILASLGMNAQNAAGASSQGPLYGYNETSLTGQAMIPVPSQLGATYVLLRILLRPVKSRNTSLSLS